jgi:translocation and assembly module TamB
MRRALRICAWVAASVLATALILAGTLYVAGNTGRGRILLENLTRRVTSGHVSLSGMDGSFPQQLMFQQLQLSDARGVWLTADEISIRWSPFALLAGRVRVAMLHVGRIDMPRLPEPSTAAHTSDSVSIPHIDVGSLDVDLLQLGPALAGAPASLVLHGNAHLSSVKDMVIDATANRIGGEGRYDLHLHFDPTRMDAKLNLQEPASGPLENLLQLPGLGALAVTANLNGPRAAEHLDLSVDAGAFHGRAQGQFDLSGKSADLEFAFDSPALAPRADLTWRRLALQGRWHGSVSNPTADGHIEIDQLQLPGGVQLATLNGNVTADSGKATLHAILSGLCLPGSQPQLLQISPVSLDAVVQLDRPGRPVDLSLSHRLFALHASAETAPVGASQRSAVLELSVPDLSALAALGGPPLHGSALLKARLQNDKEKTPFSLDGSAALVADSEAWSGAIGTHPTLQLSGALTERALTLDSLKFTGQALSLTGSGELSRASSDSQPQLPATVHARWTLDLSDLKSLSPTLAGTLKGTGTVDGPMNAMDATARMSSVLAVRDSPRSSLTADIRLRGLPSAPSGTLAAHGSLDGAPLYVDVALERTPAGSLETLIHRAEWKSAHAEGGITVARAPALSHGQLNLQVLQLADLQHLLGLELGGSLSGALALHSNQGKTQTQLHLEAHELTAGSFRGDAQVTAEGAGDAVAFDFGLQVPELHGAPARLSAHGAADLEAHRITLATATVNYRGQDARLLAPARISWANGVSIDELQVGMQQAVLLLQGELSPALHVNASLRQVGPALINVFAPAVLATGAIEASAQLQGTVAAPTGEVRLTATGVTLSDETAFGLPALDARASARLTGDGATIDAQLTAGTRSHLNLTGQAPVGGAGHLDLKINGNLDIAMVNPLLEARGQQAAGEISVDATVGGRIADPQIGGTVSVSKGSIRDYARGLSLSDISTVMVGSEGTLQIKSFTATAAPGTVSMSGTVGLLQPGIPLTVHMTARRAQPIASKLVTATLDADLNVSGTVRERLDVSGTVDLARTLIGIPNRLPPNVAVLDVRRRGKAAAAQPDKPLVIGLDVAVKAPQEFLVQGRGLDAEMGGDMHLSGTTAAPLVTGGFDLQRGSVSVGGSRLSFTAGRVSFNGAGLKNTIDPTLDFTAQSTVGGVTATLHITGLADAPQFEFTSNPVQPPDEIMALLMFGTPAAQLSALQLAQVGATLAVMSGAGGDGGLNPLVKLQQSFGLDRLTVGAAASTSPTTENSGASIAAGRYVAKRIYIEAKQSTTGTSQLEADVDLSKHLKLQTRLGNGTASAQGTTPENDPGSSVGLTYQVEY